MRKPTARATSATMSSVEMPPNRMADPDRAPGRLGCTRFPVDFRAGTTPAVPAQKMAPEGARTTVLGFTPRSIHYFLGVHRTGGEGPAVDDIAPAPSSLLPAPDVPLLYVREPRQRPVPRLSAEASDPTGLIAGGTWERISYRAGRDAWTRDGSGRLGGPGPFSPRLGPDAMKGDP